MWKELFFVAIGLFGGSLLGNALAIRQMKSLVGDDYEINKPKVKGENNLLHIFQSNNDSEETTEEVNKKKIKLFNRKNKK